MSPKYNSETEIEQVVWILDLNNSLTQIQVVFLSSFSLKNEQVSSKFVSNTRISLNLIPTHGITNYL